MGGGQFLMSEVPLHLPLADLNGARTENVRRAVQGYLAHRKTHTLLRPSQDPRHRATVGS